MYLHFMFSLRTIIDLLIILPFYIAPYSDLRGLLYVFRVFRVFRIFSIANKFQNYDKIIMVLVLTYWSCSPALLVLGICCLTIMIFFGSIMFIIEAGVFTVNNEYPTGNFLVYLFGTGTVPSSFTSIPATMYYVSTTITTVGYGDIYPITIGGRYLAVLLFYAGLVTLALPIAIASSSFLSVLKAANINEEIENEENAIIYHENVPMEQQEDAMDTFHELIRSKMDNICRKSRKNESFDRKEFTNQAFFAIEKGYKELIEFLETKEAALSNSKEHVDDEENKNFLVHLRRAFTFEKKLELKPIIEEVKKFRFKLLCESLFNHFDCNFDR